MFVSQIRYLALHSRHNSSDRVGWIDEQRIWESKENDIGFIDKRFRRLLDAGLTENILFARALNVFIFSLLPYSLTLSLSLPPSLTIKFNLCL